MTGTATPPAATDTWFGGHLVARADEVASRVALVCTDRSWTYAGLAEYMVAPAYALVELPDALPFDAAARFGYLGTMYSALRKAGAAPGKSILINGISGTLGIGAALLAPALGLTQVYGTGRDQSLLDQVDKLAPGRLRLHSLNDGPLDEWIHQETDGYGVDIYIDALGPGAPHETFLAGMRASSTTPAARWRSAGPPAPSWARTASHWSTRSSGTPTTWSRSSPTRAPSRCTPS